MMLTTGKRALALALGVLSLAATLTVTSANPAQAAPAPISVYPLAGVYPASPDFTLTVNGIPVPVQDYSGYDIAQLAMGAGEATIAVTKINNTAIGSYDISPIKLGLTGTTSGPTLTFTVPNDEYLIVRIDGRPKLVIAIDPWETNVPATSGNGVFNISSAPYNVQPGASGAAARTAIQTALNDAAAWVGQRGSPRHRVRACRCLHGGQPLPA